MQTKLWPTDFGAYKTIDAVRSAISRMGLEYVDSFLIHWPEVLPDQIYRKWDVLEETWRGLERCLDEELVHAIGVSNFERVHFDKLVDRMTVLPHINQIEFSPFCNPIEMREFCLDNGIQLQGYCPLGLGNLLRERSILEIAEKYNRPPAQILIRFCIQSAVCTLPKSVRKHRVEGNIEVFDFNISEEDMDLLNSLHENRHYIDAKAIPAKLTLPDGYRLKEKEALKRVHTPKAKDFKSSKEDRDQESSPLLTQTSKAPGTDRVADVSRDSENAKTL